MSEEELVSRLKVEAEDATGEVLKGISERIEKVKRGIESVGSATVLGKSFYEYANLQRTMEQLGFQIKVTKDQSEALTKQFKDMSDETGIDLDKLGRVFYNFVNLSGQNVEDAAKVYRTLGDAAKVTGVDIDQLSRVAATAAADMNIKTTKDLQEVIALWTTKLPVAMLQPFLEYGPPILQTMQTIGLTGKRNAEEVALAFGQISRAVGRPRYVLREMNELLRQAETANTKLGSVMYNQFQQIRASGGDLNDMLNAMFDTLNKYKAFDPSMLPFAEKNWGISPQALQALQTLHHLMPEITKAMLGSLDARKKLGEEVDVTNNDALQSVQHLKGAIDNLELSFGHLTDILGGSAVLQGIARNFDDVTDAVETLGKTVDSLLGKGEKPKTGSWSWKQWSSAIGRDIFETGGGLIGGVLGTAVMPGFGTAGGALLGAGAGRALWSHWGSPDLGQIGHGIVRTSIKPDEWLLREYARQHGLAGPEQHSTGGIISRPTLTTAGEDGPEAIIPLTGGTGGGGGSTKANTEAVKENTAVLKRLLTEGRFRRAGSGLRAAYTPGAGELPTPADAELYGGLTPGGYGGRMVQTVRTDGSGNIIGGVPSGGLPSGMATSNIHMPNVIHGGQVPHVAPSIAPPSTSLPGLHPESFGDSGLAEMREPLMQELERDPDTRRLAMQMMATEGGAGHGQAALEALFNRTLMIRKKIPGWTLKQELNSGFYGPINRGAAQHTRISGAMAARYNRIINSVGGGSDMISGRTDQGMVGDPNWRGPGRVNVGGSREIYNFWHGRRGHANFNYEDSAAEAAQIEAAKHQTQVHQQMLDAHRRVRQEMERPIQLNMRAPLNVGARQRMSSLQSRWLAEDMLGTPRWNSQLDIGLG